MLKKFIGLSDDGFRLHECFTPGEKGDVGIKMVIGYRGDEFKVYSSEVWDDPVEEANEKQAQASAASTRSMQKHFYDLSKSLAQTMANRGARKSPLFAKPYLGAIGSFAELEQRSLIQAKSVFDQIQVKPRAKAISQFIFDEMYQIQPLPMLNPEQQGQPKRKPQPNRGPRGRKDWK